MKMLVSSNVKTPTRGTEESAGLDFYVPNDFIAVCIESGSSIKIRSGIKMVLPKGKVGIFFNKSSHGSKGLFVGACIIDSDYRGEISLDVHYTGPHYFTIRPGMKLAQMLIQNVDLELFEITTEKEFKKLSNTERGTGGFGSTGDK